jgi:TetR/AcrR family tetracycline transcriptional repressor
MALTREEIVQAALRLLDDEGLDGVTLRALADRLGVSAPTLYWHVRNKQELLDLMAEAIAASSAGDDDLAPRPGEPWWEWLHRRFREFRGALLSRRDAALVVAGNRPSPDIADRIEQLVGMLVVAGFTPPEALRFLLVLGTYATGEALETQRARGRGPEPTDVVRARRDMVE